MEINGLAGEAQHSFPTLPDCRRTALPLPTPASHPSPSSAGATALLSQASLEGDAAHGMIHALSRQDEAPEKAQAEVFWCG